MTQRKKTSTRLLSLLLAVVMVFSLLPSAALAATEVTVSFDARNGETIAPVDTIDSKITLPNTDPTWKDYRFDGWYTTIDGVNGTKVTADTSFDAAATVYAKWTKDTITVRTEALDLTGSPTAASDQGWTWDDGTSTLTLDGAIFDLTHTKMAEEQDSSKYLFNFGYAIQTKGGTVIDLVGTSSVIGPEVFSGRVPEETKTSSAISAGVLVQGACTIEGEGSLTAQGGKAIYGAVNVPTTSDRAGVSTVNAGIYCNESASQDLTEGRLTVESGTIIAKGGSYQNDATVTGGGSCTNNSSGLLAVRYTQSGGTVTGESGAEAGLSMAVGVFATMEAVLTGGVLNGACTASSAISPSAIKVPAYALGEGGGRPGGFSAENALYKGSATADGELIKAELASGSFTVDDAPAMKVNITFPPTIKLGAQTGSATFGTAANATYTVTPKGFGENDFPAYDPSIQWKDGEAWSTTAPTGVTAALNDQKNSVTVTYDGAANAGDYLFRVVSPEASPLTGNYASADTAFTVSKASYTADPITKTISQTVNKPGASGATLTATDITALPGATITAITGSTTNVLTAAPSLADGTVTYNTKNVSNPATDEYTLTISTTNYSDITATLTFAAVSKTDVTVDVTAVSIPGVAEGKITYTGNAMTYVGTPTAPLISADGFTYTWQKKNSGGTYDTVTGAKGAGDYKLIVSVSDSNEAYQGKGEIPFAIEAKALTVAGLTATNRAYDGTTAVTLTGGTLVGVVLDDTVTAAIPTTGAIAAAGIGTGKSVTLAAITLGGADKDNYTLTQPTATVDITAAEIEVTGNGTYAVTKAYDGTTNPGIGSGALAFSGKVVSEDVSVSATVGAYADANVGTGKTVTLTLTLDGTGKSNYVLKSNTYSFTAAAITKGTYSGGAAAKTVEVMIKKAATQPGTLTAGDFFTSAPEGAKITAVTVNSATNSILSAAPTVTDGTLSYTGAANLTTKDLTDTYNVTISTTNYNDITATLTVKTVDKTVVTVTATDVSIPGVAEGKITYTGSAIGNPTGTPTASAGSLTEADFEYVWQKKNSSNVYETVTQADVKNAGDYQLIAKVKESNATYQGSSTPIAFTIEAKALTVTGLTATNRAYDGTTAVTLTGGTLVGVVEGNTVTAAMPNSGTIAAAGIGTGKTVTFTAITLDGAGKDNYTLTQPTATVDITAAEIEVAGNGTYAVTKVYDGTTNPGIGSGALAFSGKVVSEDVSVSATVGAYADANVGTGKTVTLTLTLDGTGKSNYVLKSNTYSFTAAAITKGTYSGGAAAKTVEVMIKKAATQPGTLTAGDFFASAPEGAKITAVTVNSATNSILSAAPTVADDTLSYTGAANLTTKDLTDTYNVTISTTNYNDITATLTVKTVDKTVVTVTATDVSIPGVAEGKITYTGNAIGNPTGTPTASAGGLTEADFEYVWQKKNSGGSYETVAQSDVKNAGDYQLIAKVKESNATYQGSSTPIAFTITKAVVTEPTIPGKVYNGSTQTADVPASDRWTVTTNSGGTGSVDAETEYDVVLTLTDSTNYKWSTVDTQTVTLKFKIINKTEVVIGGTIKVDGLDGDNKITYGGTAVTMSGTATAPNIPADGFTYTWQRKNGGSYENILNNVAPQNAGDYKLIVAVKSGNADYMGSKEIAFTIAKKNVTASVKNVGINTGSTVPAFGLTFDGLIGNDVITLTPTPVFECKKDGVTVDGKTAGTYDIVWTNRAGVTVTGDENYDVTLPDAANAKGTLTVTTPSSSGGGSSTPSAGIVIDGKTENLGTVSTKNGTTTVTLNEKKLSDKLADAKNGGSVVIPVSGSANSAAAQLTGKSVEDMAKKDMTLTVQAKGVTYEMPASAVDTAGVLAELGATDASKVPFTVTMTQEKNLKVENATIIGTPVSFTVTATYNGKSVTVDRFSAMVSRSIEITKEQAGKITTAVVVENGKVVRHVPTDVYELNGKFYAKINSMTNSTYTLIENESVFTDVAGKWYAAAADELSAREVTENVFGTAFEGEKNITRAEFAALLVNALGLPTTENATFNDVASDAWYSKAVATASRYGIVNGVGRNKFAPDATITRQEAMVMMARAAEVADWAGDGQAAAGFTDLDQVAQWAAEGVAFNTANGLIVGIGGMVKPGDLITRGETVTVVLRLLQKAELVDVRSEV